MTRLESVERELREITKSWSPVIERQSVTSVQIRIRLFPNGGLVRQASVSVEEERNHTGSHG